MERCLLKGSRAGVGMMLAALFLAASAEAQTMIEAEMTGQTLSTTKNGMVTGCGIRVVGVVQEGVDARLFDVSINISRNYGAAIKLTGKLGKIGNDSSEMKAQTIYGGWMKAPREAVAAPTGNLMSGETPESKLFPVGQHQAAKVLGAMASDEPIQIAIRWNPSIETIYFGKVDLSDAQRKQFIECIDELKVN